MSISQETANLIDTLATAASKIGSTEGSRRLNAVIVNMLDPAPLTEEERTALEVSAANADVFRAQLVRLAQLDHDMQSADVDQQGLITEEINEILAPWLPVN